ncbi:MAG: hypothetical protein AAFZ06_15030 [Pseudomonadota bacterium]
MIALRIALLLLLFPCCAQAHPADEGGLIVGFMGAERDEASGDVTVSVSLINATGERATLRGVRATVGEDARVLTSVRFWGLSFEREARFFALDAGETRRLTPPKGRILVRGVSEAEVASGVFRLTLFFGPVGSPEIMVRLGALPELNLPELNLPGLDAPAPAQNTFGPPDDATF